MAAPPSAPPYPSAPPPSYEETVGGANNSAQYPAPAEAVKGGVPPAPRDPHPPPAHLPFPVQPVYIPTPMPFRDLPVHMCCPACRGMIVTRPVRTPGTLAWLSCCTLFLLGCWLGCCLIPFCMDPLLDVTHVCPNCNALLGYYKRL